MTGGSKLRRESVRSASPGQMPPGPRNYFNVVFTQATIQGFLVHQFEEDYTTADRRLADWVRQGEIKQREDVVEGFENAPRALMRLFEGANRGKQLLKVADIDPALDPQGS